MRNAAERIYRRLLRLLPRHLREEAAEELVETFHAAHARVAGRTAVHRARFWLRMVADLVVTSIAERRPRSTGLKQLARDVRLAGRRMRKTPGSTLVNAGTLALGIAAALVCGVLVRDVLLRPLPFPESHRLVRLHEVSDDGRAWWPSVPNAIDWREHARVFDGVAIADIPRTLPVQTSRDAVRVTVSRAGRGMFETLGVRLSAGRLFTADETRPGGPPVAIVTESFWRRQLDSRPPGDLAVTIGTQRYVVVGVLASEFRFLGDAAAWSSPAEIWTPLDRDTNHGTRTTHGVHVVGRLRAGISLADARREMNRLAARLKQQHGEPTQADTIRLTPLQDVVVRTARDPLRLLLYAAGIVLLVSCLNLAAGILSQGLSRDREFSVRLALGASRWTLSRHLLIEAGAIAIPAVLMALSLAALGLKIIRASAPGTLPRLDEVRLDPQALAGAAGLALLTAIVAGVLPAVVLSRGALMNQLRAHGGTTRSRRHQRLWTLFVVAQVTLSVVLLAGTGLLVRSFQRALAVNVGYDPRNVLTVEVALPEPRYTDARLRVAYYDTALERVRSAGGVVAAGLTSAVPHNWSIFTGGTSREAQGERSVMAATRLIDARYFAAIGIAQLQGDVRLDQTHAVIDRRLSGQLWADQSPLGGRIATNFVESAVTVAGVVDTVREWNQTDDDTMGVVYVDFHHHPARTQTMYFVVRVAGDPAAVAGGLRQVFAGIDPGVPVSIARLESQIAESLLGRRLQLLLAAGFGLVSLLLATAGVHAMVAFAVSRQIREAAIRLALGARPAAVGRRVLLGGVLPPAGGLLVGLALALPVGAAIRSQLFQVRSSDPLVLASAALAVLAAALLAAAIPARRATRVDPVTALRID